MSTQRIVSFHQDEFEDWVANLECGHSQHMRHDPPWQNRQWVVNKADRDKKIGFLIECRRCQQSN